MGLEGHGDVLDQGLDKYWLKGRSIRGFRGGSCVTSSVPRKERHVNGSLEVLLGRPRPSTGPVPKGG